MHPVLTLFVALAQAPAVGPSVAEPAAERAPTAGAEEPAPDPAQQAGALFEAGRFVEAAEAFERAYVTTGDAAFLFGRAAALRRAGNCNGAIDVLEQFIATTPPAADVEEAQRVIDTCRSVLGEPEPTVDPIGPEPSATPQPSGDASDRPAPTWRRDVPGGVLVGVGSVASVAGAGLLIGAVSLARDRQETEADYERRVIRLRNTRTAGIALAAVGGSLIVGGIVRYIVVARRGESSRQAFSSGAWRF